MLLEKNKLSYGKTRFFTRSQRLFARMRADCRFLAARICNCFENGMHEAARQALSGFAPVARQAAPAGQFLYARRALSSVLTCLQIFVA